jgi:hypothetical protein
LYREFVSFIIAYGSRMEFNQLRTSLFVYCQL